MCARVGVALDELAERHDGEEVVVVTHGGAIRGAVAHALGLTGAQALRLSVQNLSMTVLEKHASAWRAVTVNDLPGI